MASREGERFLAKIPMSRKASPTLDAGEPFVLKYPDNEETKILEHITDEVIKFCEERSKK